MKTPSWTMGLIFGIPFGIGFGICMWVYFQTIWIGIITGLVSCGIGFVAGSCYQDEENEKEDMRELIRIHKEKGCIK